MAEGGGEEPSTAPGEARTVSFSLTHSQAPCDPHGPAPHSEGAVRLHLIARDANVKVLIPITVDHERKVNLGSMRVEAPSRSVTNHSSETSKLGPRES